MNSSRMSRWHLFTGVVFAVSWIPVGLLYLAGVRLAGPTGLLLAILYMSTPALSVVLVDKVLLRAEKRSIRNTYQIRFSWNRWMTVAWLWPVIISLFAMPLALILPGISWTPDMQGMFDRYAGLMTPEQIALMQEQISQLPIHPLFLSIVMALVAGLSVNAIAGFGEELGWRGLMVHELRKMNFWKANLIIGTIWGLWHAPLILQGHNYPSAPVAGVVMMIIWTILLSPLFAYTRAKSGTVLAAAVSHGVLNASYTLSILFLAGGNEFIVGIFGLAGFIALALANLLIYVRGDWRGWGKMV